MKQKKMKNKKETSLYSSSLFYLTKGEQENHRRRRKGNDCLAQITPHIHWNVICIVPWLGYVGKSEIENLLEKMAQGQGFWKRKKEGKKKCL